MRSTLTFALLAALIISDSAHSATKKVPTAICVKNSNGQLFLRPKCKAGETKISTRDALVGAQGPAGANGTNGTNGSNGADGAAGTNGTNGADGEDGAIRVYGDGSAGPLNVTSTVSWFNNPPADNNLQFSTCSVAAGQVLTVHPGTVIRCNSTANIAGTIVVNNAPNSGAARRTGVANFLISPAYRLPAGFPGFNGPSAGEISLIASGTSSGGDGGGAIKSLSGTADGQRMYASLLRGNFVSGGGGAASVGTDTLAFGGNGGGGFGLIAKQGLSVSGSIIATGGAADAFPGSGGGAGGFILLASGSQITVTGSTLAADGAGGGPSDGSRGAGGGGGGGVIVAIAPVLPSLTDLETVSDVSGGTAGDNSVDQNSASIRQAGSGGGGLGGEGGRGAHVITTSGTQTAQGAVDGQEGVVTAITADPAALLLY